MGSFKNFYTKQTLNLIIEGFILDDYLKTVPSKRNREWLEKRRKFGQTGSFLTSLDWNEKNDILILNYITKPTPTLPILNVSKTAKVSKGKKYTSEIQFQDVKKYIGDKKTFLSNKKSENVKNIRKMATEAEIKVYSNSPDFLFQGAFKRLDQQDASIYKFPNLSDKGIWGRRHGKHVYITKGLLEIMQTIKFNISSISKMIRDKYS